MNKVTGAGNWLFCSVIKDVGHTTFVWKLWWLFRRTHLSFRLLLGFERLLWPRKNALPVLGTFFSWVSTFCDSGEWESLWSKMCNLNAYENFAFVITFYVLAYCILGVLCRKKCYTGTFLNAITPLVAWESTFLMMAYKISPDWLHFHDK
jgi:hypothetical protein